MATMDAPEQQPARVELQATMKLIATQGGAAKLRENVKDKAPDIDFRVPQLMQQFSRTMKDGGTYNDFASAVTHLAYAYAYKGEDPQTAATHAYDAVIGQKYEFWNTVRAPKGLLEPMQRAADAKMAAITLDTVRDPGPSPDPRDASNFLRPEQRQERELIAIRRGHWAMAPDGSTWRRMAVRNDGAVIPALVNGQPVDVSFAEARAMPAPTPGQNYLLAPEDPRLSPGVGLR